MGRSLRLAGRLAGTAAVAAGSLLAVVPDAGAVPSLLDQCVSSINEAGFTKDFIVSETGFADEAALLSAVSAGTWTLQISSGAGWNPTLRGNAPDIYCGDSGNNYVAYLDSHPSGSHDFFFAGAGNDSVNTMWDSRFWGGAGDDIIYNNRERSIFYGGSGNNSCLNRESSGSYIAVCDNNGGPLLGQSPLSLVTTTMNIGSSLTLSTSGGSGSGAVSYALTAAGSAGCSLVGAVLSAASAGTCTVTATKAADSTYSSATTGAVTITVTAVPTTTTSTTTTTTTTPPVATSTTAPALEIIVNAPTTVAAPPTQSSVVDVTVPLVAGATTVPKATVAPRATVAQASTTTSTSTTTTSTLPNNPGVTVAPSAPQIVAVAPGEAAVTVGDRVEEAVVERADNQVTVRAGELSATFGSLDSNGSGTPLDADGNIRLQPGDTVRVRLAGFKPGSTVEAWLFSTPVLMGTAKVGADGQVSGNFVVPRNAPDGAHRIAIVARTKDGKPATLTVGVMVGEWESAGGVAVWLIVLPIVLAVLGALVLPATRRRRNSRNA